MQPGNFNVNFHDIGKVESETTPLQRGRNTIKYEIEFFNRNHQPLEPTPKNRARMLQQVSFALENKDLDSLDTLQDWVTRTRQPDDIATCIGELACFGPACTATDDEYHAFEESFNNIEDIKAANIRFNNKKGYHIPEFELLQALRETHTPQKLLAFAKQYNRPYIDPRNASPLVLFCTWVVAFAEKFKDFGASTIIESAISNSRTDLMMGNRGGSNSTSVNTGVRPGLQLIKPTVNSTGENKTSTSMKELNSYSEPSARDKLKFRIKEFLRTAEYLECFPPRIIGLDGFISSIRDAYERSIKSNNNVSVTNETLWMLFEEAGLEEEFKPYFDLPYKVYGPGDMD